MMGCCGGPRSKIGPPESIEVEKAQGGKVHMPCCRLKFKKGKSVPVASLLGAEKGPPGKPRAEESRVENAAGRRPTCPANKQILKAEAGSSGGSSRASAVFQHPTLLNHRGGGADYPTSVSRYSRWRLRTSW